MDSVPISCTPPELREIANKAIKIELPTKSKPVYEKEYQNFCTWCNQNNVTKVSENVLLAYFGIMSETKKSSTMWSSYSMLRSCLSINRNIDISKFLRLIAFLRIKSENHEPKKSSILQPDDITKFINDADDDTFLAMKIVLIMGYCGACRRDELTRMTVNDVEFKSDAVVVSVLATQNKISRVFLITEPSWILLIKKYVQLRPPHTSHNRFFLTYRRGRCTFSPIGINKIGVIPKIIAKFLKLSDPDKYTGHCFRRSSASHLGNRGGDLFTIKMRGGRKSSAVGEGFDDAYLKKKVEVAEMVSHRLRSVAATSTVVSPATVWSPTTNLMSSPATENIINTQICVPNRTVTHTEGIPSKQTVGPISIFATDGANITVNIYNNCTIVNN